MRRHPGCNVPIILIHAKLSHTVNRFKLDAKADENATLFFGVYTPKIIVHKPVSS